ncbi:MAG: hypothetical protein HeimC3_53550 [Candidatus Heimdallarchaeota archaeon LC_3]|nr:MAG: hypothetical protein HeimC3_53550 [Candidatus Heimdallarchaeota archaeon LC_3]
MKKIYLDEFQWINLLRAKKGNQENYEALLNTLANPNGSFSLHLSYANVYETLRQSNERKSNELLRFQIKMSNGRFIAPWSVIIPIEIRNVIREILGRSNVDIRRFVFGEGLRYFFGDYESNQEIYGIFKSQSAQNNFLLRFFTSTEFPSYVKDQVEKDTIYLHSTLTTMIQSEYNQKDKVDKKKKAKGRTILNLNEMIFDEIDGFREKGNFSFKDLEIIKQQMPTTIEGFENLLSRVPTLNTFSKLNYTRNTSMKMKKNDFYDLQISIAIPYCDIVMAEKSWSSIAKNHQLDRYNNTLITQAFGLKLC